MGREEQGQAFLACPVFSLWHLGMCRAGEWPTMPSVGSS